jgi:GNAT superfamily N-acetyltransferase
MIRPVDCGDPNIVKQMEGLLTSFGWNDQNAFSNIQFAFAKLEGPIIKAFILITEDNYINYLVVDRHCQRQGLGSLLLHTAEQEIRTHGQKTIRLTANTKVAPFYARNRYNYVQIANDGRIDMEKILEPSQ